MKKNWVGNRNSIFKTLGASNHTDKEREVNDFVDVKGYENRLMINKNGDIYSKISNKILKQSKLPRGYMTLILMLNNPRKTKTLYVHRLLMETFKPCNQMNQLTVNHKDGNKGNNDLDNLEWCSQSENNQHAIDMGLRIPNIKGLEEYRERTRVLSNKEIRFIKKNKHLSANELAKKLNNSHLFAIKDVIGGRTWKNI